MNLPVFPGFARTKEARSFKCWQLTFQTQSHLLSCSWKQNNMHGVPIKWIFISQSFTSDCDGLTTICICMYGQVSHCQAGRRMGMDSWEKNVEFKFLCVSSHTSSCLPVNFFCYTRRWYTSVSHLEDPLDENCSLKFQKLGLDMEDFYIIVIPQHQGFIEGDQTLAMGILSVNRTKWEKRRGKGRVCSSTHTAPILRKCILPPQYWPFLSIKEPIIICSQRNMLKD